MANRNKFEEMLERLVNEDRTGAEELFHEIVVERSREIYENLLAEEADDEDIDEATDEEVDESEEDLDEAYDDEDDDDLDEAEEDDLDEAEEDDLDEGFFGEADPTDDMMGDIAMPGDEMDMGGDDMGMDDMGMDDMGMGGEGGDTDSRIADLEDELEALKAEFEALMGGEGDEDDMDMDDMDMGGDDMGDDEEEGDEEEGDDDESEMPFKAESRRSKSNTEMMREYADKVAPAKMGDNGANTKSTLAKPNNMGGTTANIAKSSTEAGVEANKGNLKGSALSNQNPKDMNTKNVNVPGAKAATKMTAQPGHGAEKKGKPESAASKSSMLNGAPKRAK
jgi:hypothetical protein